MKKIMIIHHSGSIGGAGVSIYNTILSLKAKYEVVIYCPSNPDDYNHFLNSQRINVKTFDLPLGTIQYYSGGAPVYSPVFLKSLLNIIKYKRNWEEMILKEDPDLVIVNSKIMSWFSLITNKLGIKSACFVRETRKNSFLNVWNNIERYFLNKFSGVLFISNYDKNKENLKSPITIVVPNYLDLNLYEKKKSKDEVCKLLGISPSRFNILFVGGMLRIKGLDVAVKSMKYLQGYNVNLIVAGDPNFHYNESKGIYTKVYNFAKKKYEEGMLKEIKKYDLDKRIFKVGIQKDMADMYTLSDVLIFPANEPHQARPAFEAGAQKKPVIMPDFENTREYVKNEENGLIFKRRNAKSLAKCIIRLIEDHKLKIKLGEENFKNTVKNHTKEHSEAILLEMIDEIMGDSKR